MIAFAELAIGERGRCAAADHLRAELDLSSTALHSSILIIPVAWSLAEYSPQSGQECQAPCSLHYSRGSTEACGGRAASWPQSAASARMEWRREGSPPAAQEPRRPSRKWRPDVRLARLQSRVLVIDEHFTGRGTQKTTRDDCEQRRRTTRRQRAKNRRGERALSVRSARTRR